VREGKGERKKKEEKKKKGGGRGGFSSVSLLHPPALLRDKPSTKSHGGKKREGAA